VRVKRDRVLRPWQLGFLEGIDIYTFDLGVRLLSVLRKWVLLAMLTLKKGFRVKNGFAWLHTKKDLDVDGNGFLQSFASFHAFCLTRSPIRTIEWSMDQL